jgi:hypothetical protein
MWDEQVQPFLEQHSGITRRRYGDALREFAEWYRTTYGESPDIRLLTPQEVREYVSYLTTVRRLKAASVNVRLAAIRSLARFHERELRVRGVRQERPPVEALDGRELGRLMAALEGDDWVSRRNRAMVALMARAGLRVGEVLALKPEDVELNARSGSGAGAEGEGDEGAVGTAFGGGAAGTAGVSGGAAAAVGAVVLLPDVPAADGAGRAAGGGGGSAAGGAGEAGDAAHAAAHVCHALSCRRGATWRRCRWCWGTPVSPPRPAICIRMRGGCRRWWRNCSTLKTQAMVAQDWN